MTRLQWLAARQRCVGLMLFTTLLSLLACTTTDETPTPTSTPRVEPTATAQPTPNTVEPSPTLTPPSTEPPPTPSATPPTPPPSPIDATPSPSTVSIEVEMRDFVFVFDPAEISSTKPLSFRAINRGQQAYELVLVHLAEVDGTLLDLLQSASAQPLGVPQGIDLVGRTGPVAPQQSATLQLDRPLRPGKYAIVSLLPDVADPDQVLQAFKGMVAEFRVAAES